MDRRPLNLREAGQELGLAPSTVRERILAGHLEAERDGRRWVIYPDEIKQYRERRRYGARSGCQNISAAKSRSVAALTDDEKDILDRVGICSP